MTHISTNTLLNKENELKKNKKYERDFSHQQTCWYMEDIFLVVT
jgi:hypothetical protein